MATKWKIILIKKILKWEANFNSKIIKHYKMIIMSGWDGKKPSENNCKK